MQNSTCFLYRYNLFSVNIQRSPSLHLFFVAQNTKGTNTQLKVLLRDGCNNLFGFSYNHHLYSPVYNTKKTVTKELLDIWQRKLLGKNSINSRVIMVKHGSCCCIKMRITNLYILQMEFHTTIVKKCQWYIFWSSTITLQSIQ
jgi:hypothetical protein